MFKVSWILDFLLGPKLYFDSGQPTTPEKTTQVSELPDWAKGYAKDTLAKGAALTDVNQNPYQTYGGERIAGFSDLQKQAQQGAAGMQTAGQVGLGSGLAGAAGLGALGTNYQGGNFYGGQFNSDAAKQYMNPYMQNVVDIQQREAQRQADIAGTQRNAQAVGAGAFGGSRQAITDAEAARNLATQKGDIQAQGLNQAYGQAANQFNQDYSRNLQAQQLGEQSRQYGAGLGMQGLQTGLQAAGQLGQLGQTQYGQEMGINQLQNQYGAQQQQQQQRGLDTAYQDFLNQQNYPYKQLGFMSDLVRGMPLGQQSTSAIYQAPPSMAQTIGALGVGAIGASKAGLFADGGLMKSYAGGGVTSPQNVENILSKLSDQQLQQAKEAALNRRDVEEAQMIDTEMAERASIRGGLGGAFNQIPVEQQEAMMAGGGMVAFAPGGTTYLDQAKEAQKQQLGYIDQATAQPSVEEQKSNILAQQQMLKGIYPESVLPKYLEETQAERAKLPARMEKDSGLAMVLAAADLLEGTSLTRAGAKAARTYIGEVSRLKSENIKADNLLRQSEVQLATAKELHDNGMVDKAIARAEKSQDLKSKAAELKAGVAGDSAKMYSQLEGTKLGADAQKYVADVGYKGHLASAAATMNKPSAQMEGVKIKADDIRRRNPNMPESQVKDQALKEYLAQTRTGMSGVDARIEATAREKATKDYNDAIAPGGAARKEYKELQKKGTPEQVRAFEEQLFNKYLGMHSGETPAAPGVGAPGSTAPAPTAAPTSAPVAVPPQAIDILKKNPSPQNIQYFDQTFGQGAAARVLGR